MYRTLLAFVMVAVLVVPIAVSAARKDGLPATPCTVQPRTEEEVAALVATATATPESNDGSDFDEWVSSPADLPQGDPADQATVDAVTAAAREFAGCSNTGDVPRRLALMTDHLLAEVVESSGVDALFAATGTPSPGDNPGPEIVTVRVSDARVLPDGRVGAVVVWQVQQPQDEQPLPEANFHIFQRVGNHWLLDEEISGYVEEAPGRGGRRKDNESTAMPTVVAVPEATEPVPSA